MNEINNSIWLTGRVLSLPEYDHTILSENFFRTFIEVKRLSGTADVLPVTLSERLMNPSAFPEPGGRVSILGQIRSYNRRSEDGCHLIITVFGKDVFIPDECQLEDVNEAELTGFICKAPVFRTTPFMREISDVILAVGRGYGKTDFIPLIAWGRNARFAAELRAGERIDIRGRLQSRKYRKLTEHGEEERTAYEVSCASIERAGE